MKGLQGTVFQSKSAHFLIPMAQAYRNNILQPNMDMQNLIPSTSEDPGLNLGLTLGGIYTGYPYENPLPKSSTVAGVLTLDEEPQTAPRRASPRPPLPMVPLASSSSSFVPAQTGQRMMRRKDLLALRRLEAKERLAERQRNDQLAASLPEKTQPPAAAPTSSQLPRLTAWSISSVPDGTGTSSTVFHFKAEGLINMSSPPREAGGFEALPSGRSIEPVVTSAEVANTQHAIANPPQNAPRNPSKRVKISKRNVPENDGKAATAEVPSIKVKTSGPDGRQIEGILHRYIYGRVRIACACHGSFHSPAGFVKHAGVKDVANPMRHIIVCSTPSDH